MLILHFNMHVNPSIAISSWEKICFLILTSRL